MDTGSGKFEVLVDEVGGRSLRFCSNVIETSDGTIYFTESTSALTYQHYMGVILEARGRGSLFRRDADGTVLTVVPGLHFANGVTVTADESALVFAVTPLVTNLPGYPDSMSTGADGRIWVAMASPINRLAEWLAPRPPILGKVLWQLPDRLSPQIKPDVWAVAFGPDRGEAVAGLHGQNHRFGIVTGLIEARATADGLHRIICRGLHGVVAHVMP